MTAHFPHTSARASELVRTSNLWRDNYNPLRGLVLHRAVAMLEAADRGDFPELQLTLRKLEKRYPVLKALKARRTSALEKLDWDVKAIPADRLPAGYTPAQAEAQRQFLRARYDALTNLEEAVQQLALAEFRGFTILQKHRYADGQHDGAVRELHWLPAWCFSRDGQFGDFFYNQDSKFGLGVGSCLPTLGEENRIPSNRRDELHESQTSAPSQNPALRTSPFALAREDFVIREVESPLYEIALLAYVNWAMGRKDFAAFVEIFGLPNAIVIMPPNIPAGKEEEYLAAAEHVAEGVSGALPHGSDAKFPNDGVRGESPFKEFCDAQDADVVLAGTGGLLTMLAQPAGLGHGASQQHGDAFADLAAADARRISETLQRDFDLPELAANFPGQPVLAYFELFARPEKDVTLTVEHITALKNAGYPITPGEVQERTGYQLSLVADDVRSRREPIAPTSSTTPASQDADSLAPLGERAGVRGSAMPENSQAA